MYCVFFLMIRRPPRSTRTDHTLSLHDALPILVRGSPVQLESPYRNSHAEVACFVTGARISRPASRLISPRSEEHTSELHSLMRISYAVFCLKKTIKHNN